MSLSPCLRLSGLTLSFTTDKESTALEVHVSRKCGGVVNGFLCFES